MLVFGLILAPALLITSATAASRKEDAVEVTASLFCLSHSRFKFEEPRAREHRVRYLIDTESFEGQRLIMLFVEVAGGRTRWYDIEVFAKGPARRYRLVNNAEFVAVGKSLRFVDPPLGGISTNDRLASAFTAIRLRQAVIFKAKKLSHLEQCRSFDDGIR